MSFLRFIFTGVYSKATGSLLPVHGNTPLSCAPGTPPALHGPLVPKPFTPAVSSALGACPALPDTAVQRCTLKCLEIP